MAKRYQWVRMRKEDYEKIVRTKKQPIQNEIRMLMNKPDFNLKDTQLFRLAAASVWDLGDNYKEKISRTIKRKGGGFKI
jgi:hypothetical protein|tara:strand:- start:15489 stop:15725 length:237 start_codon:yes stop_codon:yes gene_type:complete